MSKPADRPHGNRQAGGISLSLENILFNKRPERRVPLLPGQVAERDQICQQFGRTLIRMRAILRDEPVRLPRRAVHDPSHKDKRAASNQKE